MTIKRIFFHFYCMLYLIEYINGNSLCKTNFTWKLYDSKLHNKWFITLWNFSFEMVFNFFKYVTFEEFIAFKNGFHSDHVGTQKKSIQSLTFKVMHILANCITQHCIQLPMRNFNDPKSKACSLRLKLTFIWFMSFYCAKGATIRNWFQLCVALKTKNKFVLYFMAYEVDGKEQGNRVRFKQANK